MLKNEVDSSYDTLSVAVFSLTLSWLNSVKCGFGLYDGFRTLTYVLELA
jgi:hypothetical protein